ncbi:MAG: hypothetical protein GXN91_00955, partial [Epsilonproteobacteria bacterium]|nr:hypothetical protein [Campylobacterota bacterium]
MRNILILILLLIGLIDAKIYILKGEQREGSLLDNAEIISPSVYIPTKARIIDFYIGNRAGRVSQSYFCIWDKRAQKVVICGGGRYGDIRGVVLEPGEYFVFPSVNTYVNVKLKSEDESKRGDGSSFNGNNKKTATYILEGEQKEGSFMENARLNAPVYYIPQTIKIVDFNSYSIDSKESNMPFCIWNKDTQRAVACGGRGYGNIKGTILKPGKYFILPPANVHVKVVAKAVESNNNYPPSKPDNNFNNQGKNGSNSANKELAYYNFGVREPWFRGWRVYTALEDGKPGKIPESNNRFGWYSGAKDVGHAMPPKKETKGAVLYLHPASRTTPTILKKRLYVPYNKDLYLRVAGNRNGDWLLEVDVNGKTIFSKVIDGRKWYEIRIPLSKYGGKRVDLAIKVKANGWYFEYAYFDEVALVDSKKIKNNSNNSGNDNGSIMSKMEYGIDRPGMDYSSFALSVADPKLCEKRCEADSRCRAWTYVKPNTFQGPKPMCWLKDAIPAPVKNKDCISGFKNAHIDTQDML